MFGFADWRAPREEPKPLTAADLGLTDQQVIEMALASEVNGPMDLAAGARRAERNGEAEARKAFEHPMITNFEALERSAHFFAVAQGLRNLVQQKEQN